MTKEAETVTLDLPDFLASTALFSALTAAELGRIASLCTLRRLAKGDNLFRAGDPCQALHMVAEGRVKLFVASPNGHEKVIEIFGPGQSFAEAIMFLDKPYIFNAQALGDVVLVEVGKQGVRAEIARDPKFAMHLLGGVSRRLQTLIQDVEGYTLKSGKQRLIEFLLRELAATAQGEPTAAVIHLPASKSTIASRLSLTPEYFSRVLHDLQDQRLIKIDKRAIHVPDLQALRAQAGA